MRNYEENILGEESYQRDEKLTSLLQEYTDKLRIHCHEKVRKSANSRRQLLLVLFTCFSSLLFLIFFGYFRYGLENINVELVAMSGGAFLSILFIFFFISQILRADELERMYIEAKELKDILSHLVKTTSQYHQHARSKIGNEVEFSLRLREAETVISTFEYLYREKRKHNEFSAN